MLVWVFLSVCQSSLRLVLPSFPVQYTLAFGHKFRSSGISFVVVFCALLILISHHFPSSLFCYGGPFDLDFRLHSKCIWPVVSSSLFFSLSVYSQSFVDLSISFLESPSSPRPWPMPVFLSFGCLLRGFFTHLLPSGFDSPRFIPPFHNRVFLVADRRVWWWCGGGVLL